jgi:prepilin-type N-terminal cleavage/methylation domain-containing protein
MKTSKLNQKGFSIIEVLIVLAIAAVIILVVFLAVPALQRNSRNSQRDADASKILAAVSQCLANRNGQTDSCDEPGDLATNGGLDWNSLSQIDEAEVTADATMPGDGEFNAFSYGFGEQCEDDGSDFEPAGNNRAYAGGYRLEDGGNGITKCVQS